MKRTIGFETEYIEGDFKLAELNFYLLDEVLIRAQRYVSVMAHAVRRAGVSGGVIRAAQQTSLTRIFKGVSIQPLTLHFFFKDLAKLPSAFPAVAQYRFYLGMLERLGSFHFLGPRFYQSVNSPEIRGSRGTRSGAQDPFSKEHNGSRCRHEQQGTPEACLEGGQIHRVWCPE